MEEVGMCLSPEALNLFLNIIGDIWSFTSNGVKIDTNSNGIVFWTYDSDIHKFCTSFSKDS